MSDDVKQQARELLRNVLGIPPGERIEAWHGVSIDDALRTIERALTRPPREEVVERVGNLLANDPVCNGRVLKSTVEAIAALCDTLAA